MSTGPPGEADLRDALTVLLGIEVDVEEHPARRYALGDIPDLAGRATAAVGVYLQSEGEVLRHILLILSLDGARRIGALMLGGEAAGEHLLDACRELGNIVAARYLSRFATAASARALLSAPQSAVDMAGDLIRSVTRQMAGEPRVQAIELRMQTEEETTHGLVLVLHD